MMYKNIVLLSVMAIVVVSAMPTALAGHPANSVYFEPESINGVDPYTNVVVNASVITKSVGVDIYFDPTCVNITDVDFAGTPYNANTGWSWWGNYIRIGAINYGDVAPGTHLVAKLEFECVNGDCTSDVEFSGALELTDSDWKRVDANWINGTFTCGAGAQPPCLGTCCNDSECTDQFAENVPCKECIEAGRYWHPNMDTACFGDTTPSNLCLDWCPECCDGVNNDDADTNTDYPADGNCTCGLDPSEAIPINPIPELSTFLLTSLGILSLVLLTRKRD